MHRLPTLLTATIVSVSFGACATPKTAPGPLVPPSLELWARHYAGTVLSGRQTDANPVGPLREEATLAVSCRVTYLRTLRTGPLHALPTRTRLVVAGRSGQPLVPVARAITGAVVGKGPAARAFHAEVTSNPADVFQLAEMHAALHPGVTASFHARSKEWVRQETESVYSAETRLSTVILVSIDEGADAPTVALQIDRSANANGASPEIHVAEDGRVTRRQIILLEDAPVVDGDPLVLVFPSPFVRDEGRAFAVELTLQSAHAVGPELLARCREDLAREGAAARAEQAVFGGGEAQAVTLATSLESLELARHHRSTLVFLARSTGARLALDLALTGDDATLAAWIQELGPQARAALQAEATSARGTEFGWALERSAYRLLGHRLDEGALSTELSGVLAQHAGEVGRFPGAIGDLLRGCKSRVDLQAALVFENREFLDAAEPQARTRAFDWLLRRGAAPEDYDPLAGRKERRAALSRAAEAAARKDAQQEVVR